MTHRFLNGCADPDRVHRTQTRLVRGYRVAVYVILGSTLVTGILWLVFHYFFRRQGQFGVEPHPLEAWWLTLHGAGAFAALWLCGLLWGIHIRSSWRLPRRRSSGIVVSAFFAVLIASGYLLYYAAGDGVRSVVSVVHWTVGLALVVPLALHVLRAKSWHEKQTARRGSR